jgi:plastocyanin
MKIRALCIVLIALFAFAGCSNQKKVGSAIDVNALNSKNGLLGKVDAAQKKGSGGNVLGTATPVPNAGSSSGSSAQQANAARQAQINAQKKAVAVSFAITSSGYNPYYIRVYVGGVVSVTNQDKVARSVTADQGAFDSGLIQPGQTWEYDPKSAGKFNFHDSTRPYVVGTLEVDTP